VQRTSVAISQDYFHRLNPDVSYDSIASPASGQSAMQLRKQAWRQRRQVTNAADKMASRSRTTDSSSRSRGVRDLCLTGHNLALAIQLANARILLEAEAGEADKAALDMLRGIANKAQDTFNTHLLGCAECRRHLPPIMQAVREL